MSESVNTVDWTELAKMKEIIDDLERLLLDLDHRGGNQPVIEKNVKAMMSFVAVLKYGISDMVEVTR